MKKFYFTLGLILLLTSCGYWSNKENTSTTELKTDSITYKKATPPFREPSPSSNAHSPNLHMMLLR